MVAKPKNRLELGPLWPSEISEVYEPVHDDIPIPCSWVQGMSFQ